MVDVFISYKRTPDRTALVRRLALFLRNNEISVWWDQGLESGLKFEEQIRQAIADAAIVVPLWCSQSVFSSWVLREAALGRTKLMPAKLQEIAPPAEFASFHAADLIGWRGDIQDVKATEFIQLVRRRVGKQNLIPRDTIEELSQLPILGALPPFDEKTDRLLQRFRNAMLRQDPLYQISDALKLNLDSPLSDFLGDCDSPEKFHDQLCDFCFEATDEKLIWRTDKEMLVYPDDLEGMTTLGELIDHLIAAGEE